MTRLSYRGLNVMLLLVAAIGRVTGLPVDTPKDPGVARPHAPLQYSLHDIFDVDFTGTGPGSCRKWKDRIETGFAEAMQMLSDAEKAIEGLDEDTKVHADDQKGQSERKHASKAAQAYKAAFGGSIVEKDGRLTSGAERVLRVIKALQQEHTPAARQDFKYHFRCDDDFMVTMDPTDADPRDTDTWDEGRWTVGQPRFPREPCPNGAIWMKTMPEDNNYLCIEPNVGRMCVAGKQEADAYAMLNFDLVVFCPQALDQTEKGYTGWSAKEIAPKIKEGDLWNEWTHTIAEIWIHEMVHYVLKVLDQDMVEALGDVWKSQDQSLQGKVYRWNKLMHLAQNRPARAAVSPENYAVFASTIYYSEWYWGSGSAKSAPEEEDFDPRVAYDLVPDKAYSDSSGGSTPRPPSPDTEAGAASDDNMLFLGAQPQDKGKQKGQRRRDPKYGWLPGHRNLTDTKTEALLNKPLSSTPFPSPDDPGVPELMKENCRWDDTHEDYKYYDCSAWLDQWKYETRTATPDVQATKELDV